MTDDVNAAEVVAGAADDTGAMVVGAIGDDAGDAAVGAVVTDYDYAVVVAAFSDTTSAEATYQALRDAEAAGTVNVDGVLVIKTDDQGSVKIQQMTDHSTKTGLKWGVVGGIVLGVLFPPTIIASAVATGAFGGVLGKLRNELHKSEVGDALAGALGPNESGIIALTSAADVDTIKQSMPAATKVRSAGVSDKSAKAITEAAKQAS